jgi:hypothetical protein
LGTGPLVDLCLFLEEAGAALTPGPFFATVALFAPVVAAAGDDELLARVAAGDITGSVAFGALSGAPTVEADRVDVVAVLDRRRVDEVAVRLLDQPRARVIEPFDLSRRLATVTSFSKYTTEHTMSLAAFDGINRRQVVALAADLIGATRWMLEETLAYVKERVQFDRPIGSFQALQHRLADMKLLFERAWSAVYAAAMATDADHPDAARASHVAKASAGDAARHVAKEAVQMHGGIGFTWDHDLHLYVRRAFASEQLLGTSDWHRDRLADLVL